MFGFFTKNFDTMEEATNKKKPLRELDDISRMTRDDMKNFLGGNEKLESKKKRGFFSSIFGGPTPCEGNMPQ